MIRYELLILTYFLFPLQYLWAGDSFSLDKHKQKIEQFNYSNFNLIIRKENKDKSQLNKWIKDRIFLMNSTLAPKRTPYEGTITTMQKCPEVIFPKTLKLKQESFIGGIQYVSGPRKNQLNCHDQKISYHSALVVFLCKNGSYKLKVHLPYEKPVSELHAFLETIRCD